MMFRNEMMWPAVTDHKVFRVSPQQGHNKLTVITETAVFE